MLLLTSSSAFTDHYFSAHILAITHLMALGSGTMIILGASHQLVPVLIEGKLYNAFSIYFIYSCRNWYSIIGLWILCIQHTTPPNGW